MNQLFLFIFSLILSGSHEINYKLHTSASPIDTSKVVNTLKSQFTAIDSKRKTYVQYDAEMQGNFTEGALFTGFYEGKTLKMINANYFNNLSKTESDYYLNGSGIFVIYSKVYEYINPLSADPSGKTKNITENWYYFSNESLIKWVSAGKVISGGSDEFRKKKNSFKEDLKMIKKLFSNFSTLKKVR